MKPQRPKPGYSFADLHPELLDEYSPDNEYSLWEVKPGSSYVALWTCPKGHKNYPAACRDRNKGSGCINCGYASEKHSTPPYSKSLEARFPEVAALWSPFNSNKPSEVYARAGRIKYKWICPEHGEFRSTCANMTRKNQGNGCAECRNDRVRESRKIPTPGQSLGDLYPSLLTEWSSKNELTPWDVKSGSGYVAKWICSQGHKWERRVDARTGRDKIKCPQCNDNWGTSTTEQNLRTSLIPFGVQPTSHKISNWTVDLYIPSSKTIIEYDGSYFHSFLGAYERDRRKSLELLEEGYRVIRVRTYLGQYKLRSLSILNPNYFELFAEEPLDSQPTPDLLDKITSLL